jgi:hypothetical protein
MRSTLLPFRALLPSLALLLLAACESKPDRHALVEEARRAVPPMAASENFFDGGISARLTLGSALDAGDEQKVGGPDAGDLRRTGGRRPNRGSAMTAGMGGGGMSESRYGDRGVGGMAGDEMRGGSEGSRGMGGTAGSRDGEAPAPRSLSRMPPAMLRLRLENTTAAAVVVEVREINSELGNFAVRPDKLTLAPGESAAPDPMQSLLGLDTFALPVTVTLRLAGKTETKVLTLHQVTPAEAAPPPPATGK